jgi:hypothetical protein
MLGRGHNGPLLVSKISEMGDVNAAESGASTKRFLCENCDFFTDFTGFANFGRSVRRQETPKNRFSPAPQAATSLVSPSPMVNPLFSAEIYACLHHNYKIVVKPITANALLFSFGTATRQRTYVFI